MIFPIINNRYVQSRREMTIACRDCNIDVRRKPVNIDTMYAAVDTAIEGPMSLTAMKWGAKPCELTG